MYSGYREGLDFKDLTVFFVSEPVILVLGLHPYSVVCRTASSGTSVSSSDLAASSVPVAAEFSLYFWRNSQHL